jgi:hypothetical protein
VLVAHHDNRFSLRVWPDGQAEMRFPPYAAQAGEYRWRLSAEAQAELEAQFSQLAEIELTNLSSAMHQQRTATLTELTDVDLLRLEYRQGDRAPVAVMLESPDAWHRALPELTDLARLAELQADIFNWMQRNAEVLGQ